MTTHKIMLALVSLAVAATSATAQSKKPTWDDLLKPYEAKTDPAVPAASAPPNAVAIRIALLTVFNSQCERLPRHVRDAVEYASERYATLHIQREYLDALADDKRTWCKEFEPLVRIFIRDMERY